MWATFTCHRLGVDVTKVPTERQTQTLRRHSDPVTPLRIRNVDDDGRYEVKKKKKKLQTTQRRMTRMIIHTQKKKKRYNVTQLRSASVGVIDDTEAHDSDSELVRRHDCAQKSRGQRAQRKQQRRRQQSLSFDEVIGRQSRRRARTMGGRPKSDESNAQSATTCWQRMETRRGSSRHSQGMLEIGKDDCKAPRRTAGSSLSPTGTQQYQPSKKGTVPQGILTHTKRFFWPLDEFRCNMLPYSTKHYPEN